MTITIEWHAFAALSAARLYDVLRFRQAIFVVEQASPYPDLDGLDREASHLLLLVDGALGGCLRMIPLAPEPLVRIGRVAVAAPLRHRGLARRMMIEALRRRRDDHPHCGIVLGAQLRLAPFYQGFGFAAVGAPYDDYGVSHVDMAMPPATGL